MSINKYINEKIKLLKEFDIELDYDQTVHIKSLNNEYEVDAFARDLLKISTMI